MKDRHHMLNTRAQWNSMDVSRELRSKYIYHLERETHQELHANVPPVPLLGYTALFRVLNTIQPRHDPAHDIDDLLFSIDKATRQSNTHPIERELGLLSIEAIELQRPYIMDDIY